MCEEIFALMNKITEEPKSGVDRFLSFCSIVMKISANGLYLYFEKEFDYLMGCIFNNVDNEDVKSLKVKFNDFIKADDFSPNKLKDFLESIKSNNESQSLIEDHKVDILCFFAQMRAKQIFAQNVKSDKKTLKKVNVATSDVKANSGKEEDMLISTLDPNRTFNEYIAELAKILDDKFEPDRNVINLEHILNEKFKVTDINNLTLDEQFLNFILSNDLTQESITRDPYNAALALKIPENLASETVLKIYIHVVNQFIKFGNTETLRNKIQKCRDKLLALFSLKFNNSDELLEADKKLDKHCKNLYHQHLESILIYYLEKNKMEFLAFLTYINRLNDQGYYSVICKLLGNYDFDDDILSFFCGNDDCIDPIFNYLNDHIFKFGFGDEFDINLYFDNELNYKHEKHKTMMARANLLINSLKASEIGSVKRKKLNYLISCLMLKFEPDSNAFKADIGMFIDLFELESSFFKYGVEFEEDVTDRLKQKLNRLVEEFLAQSVSTGSSNNKELYNDGNLIYLKILGCPAVSDSIKKRVSKVSNEFEHIVSHSQVLDSFQSLNASETDISNDCCSDIFKLYLEELEHRQRVFRRSYFPEDTKKKIIENLSREEDTFQAYYNQQKENFKTNLLRRENLTEKDLEKEYCRDYNDKSSALQYEKYKLDKKMSSFMEWVNGLIGDNKWVALLLLLVILTGIGFIVLYSWYRLWKLPAKREYQEIDEQYKQYSKLAQREDKIRQIKDNITYFNTYYFHDCCIELDKLIDLCQTTGMPAPPCNIFVKDKNRKNNGAMEAESEIVQDLMGIEEDEVSTNEANNLSEEQVQELVKQAKEKFNTEVKLRQQQFSGDINKTKGNSNLIKMIYNKSKRLFYSFIKKRSEQDAQIDEEAKEILDYKKLEDYFYYEDSDFAGNADKQIEREKISNGEIPVEWLQLILKYLDHDDQKEIIAKAEDGKDQLDYYGGPLSYYNRFLEEKTKDIRFINIYEDESLSTHIGAARGDSNCLLYSLLAQMSQNDFDNVVKCVDENNEAYSSIKELIKNNTNLGENHELNAVDCKTFFDAVNCYMDASDETKNYRLWEHAKYLRIYIVIQLIKQDLLDALLKEIAEAHKNSELKEIIEYITTNFSSENAKLKLPSDKVKSWANILGKNVIETIGDEQAATFGYVYGTEPIAQIISDLTKRPVFFYNGSSSNDEKKMGYIYTVSDSNNVYNLELGEVFVSEIKNEGNKINPGYSATTKNVNATNSLITQILTDKIENPDKSIVVIHYGNHFEPFGCDEYKDTECYGNLIIKHGTQKDLENKQSEKNKKGKDEVSQSKNKITVNINLPTVETPLNNISNVLNPIDVNHKSHEILKTPKIKKKPKEIIGKVTTTGISTKLNFKSNTMSANHYEKNKKNKINKYQKQIPIQDDNKEEGAILT